MDAGWAKVATDWAQFLLTGAAGGISAVWVLLGRRHRAIAQELRDQASAHADLKAQLAQMELAHSNSPLCRDHIQRTIAIETAIRLGVTKDDITRAHVRMDGFEGRVSKIDGLLVGISNNVNDILSHLLKQGSHPGEPPHR